MKLVFLSLLLLLFLENASAIRLKNGDLIFQEACSNEGIDNAIKGVTNSLEGYQFTHVGIVYIQPGSHSVWVIEATMPEVKMTPLQEYLYPKGKNSCKPKSVVGRLHKKYAHCIPQALKEGQKLVGKGYDYGFELKNDRYYCSELIYDIFLRANHNQAVFPLNVMTFKGKETGAIDEGWIKYFQDKNLPIPEGELGINPGAMSRSNVIRLLGEL